MASMKPPKKSPTDKNAEARRTNVLLEKLSGEFKTFGEGLSIVREKVERMEPKLAWVCEKVAVMEPALNQLVEEFKTFKMALFDVSKDVKNNTADIAELKTDVKDVKDRLITAEARLPA
jgi:archaellum component FlaC